MLLQERDAPRHHLGGSLSRRCVGLWERFSLVLVDPVANNRVLQQFKKLLDLWRLRLLRGRGLGIGWRIANEN